MANKIPNPNDGKAVVHLPPSGRNTLPQRQSRPASCPEEGRITDIERRLTTLETRDPPRETITTSVQALPREQLDRIDRLEREWQRVSSSQEVAVPRAMTEMFEGLHAAAERISQIEDRLNQQPVNITPQEDFAGIPLDRWEELQADLGQALHSAAQAMHTLSFLTQKIGLLTKRLDGLEDEFIAQRRRA